MSHFSKDLIADQVIDQVSNMPIAEVAQALLKAGKGTQFLVGPLADHDKARDQLIDIMFEEAMERPGPHA